MSRPASKSAGVAALFEGVEYLTIPAELVSGVTNFSSTVAARSEKAAKLAAFSERAATVLEKFVTPDTNSAGIVRYSTPSNNAATPADLEAGRLICLHDAWEKPVTDL